MANGVAANAGPHSSLRGNRVLSALERLAYPVDCLILKRKRRFRPIAIGARISSESQDGTMGLRTGRRLLRMFQLHEESSGLSERTSSTPVLQQANRLKAATCSNYLVSSSILVVFVV
jgi:hypothetical protein